MCVRDRERERENKWVKANLSFGDFLFFLFHFHFFLQVTHLSLSLSLSLSPPPLSLSLSLSRLSVCFFLLIILSPSHFDFHVLNSFNKVFLLFDSHFSYLSFYLPLAAVLVNTCLLILSFSSFFSEFVICLTCWTQVSTYLETRNLI